MRGILALAALFLPMTTTVVRAQRLAIGVNGSAIRFDSTTSTTGTAGATVGADLRGRQSVVFLGAGASGFTGGWSGQASAAGSWLSGALDERRRLHVELAASAQGSVLSLDSETWFGVASAASNLHYSGNQSGAWVGGLVQAGGNTAMEVSSTGIGPATGAWLQRSGMVASVSGSLLYLREEWIPEAVMRVMATPGIADIRASAGYRPARLGLDASVFGSIEVVLWFTPAVGLSVSAGRFPPELLQRLPAGRYASVSLQWTNRRRRITDPAPASPVTLWREDGLVLELPDAAQVEVMGDWTDWQPAPMTRAGQGTWRLARAPGPGTWRYVVRIDGGAWGVPSGMPAVDDGFGGRVAVLVIP